MECLEKLIMQLSRLSLLILLLGTVVANASAQSVMQDACTVESLDLTTKEVLELGTFRTKIGKDLSTLDSYFIRGTDKQFLLARVRYTDEDMVTDDPTGRGAKSVSFQLWIVKSPNANAARETTPADAQSFAESQQPVAGFDIGRVTLIETLGPMKRAFMMKCWRGGRNRGN